MTAATPVPHANSSISHGRIALGIAIAMALGLPSAGGHTPEPVVAAKPWPTVGIRSVTNCNDDGAGSLRAEVAAALSGDTIDLSALACSTITLTSGAITVPVDDLAIAGPGADALAIDGNAAARVFTHTGTGTLGLSDLAVRNGRVQTNVANDTARGGCIISAGTVSLNRTTATSCTAYGHDHARGGCIDTVTMAATDSRIENCTARIPDTNGGEAIGGGIITTIPGVANITRSIIIDNSAIAVQGAAHGGAIAVYGGTIQDSTLSGNSVTGKPYIAEYGSFSQEQGMGGALFIASGSPVTITGSTLSGNSATTGGAIAVMQYGTDKDFISISNSTISGNMADGMGGGLWVLFSGINITSSTIVSNQSGSSAAGIMLRHGLLEGNYTNPAQIQSSIIASNVSAVGSSDIGTILSKFAIFGSNNILGESSVPVPPDTITTDPLLYPLADNGGPTFTHAIQSNSPALDTGNNGSGLEFDQRGSGYLRVVGLAADIGAYEFQGSPGIPDSEREFLLEIYNNMHPELWFNSTGWNGPPGTECDWYGITCDIGNYHIISVDMFDNYIYGPLPQSLSEQTQLKVFNLRANYFTGTIPSLDALANLEVFDVSQFGDFGAGLTGEIPSLSHLNRLKRFGAWANSLTGELPNFEGLVELAEFDVGRNQLTGSIPPLDALTALTEFYVDENNLTGNLPELAALSNLEAFAASRNGLSGKIPEISGLTRLRWFYVPINQLDRINDSFDALPSLEEYNVGYNQLQGEIGSLDGAPNLVQFHVFYNNLTGSLPILEGHDRLTFFEAHYNQFSGNIPAIQKLFQLAYFHVGHNNLTGTIPPIAGMQHLAGFGVSNNQLSGSIPPLENLPVLFDFEVSNNQLTGSIPPLSALPSLWEFLANDNRLTGTIPRIGSLSVLETFNVSNNLLEGPPPPVVPSSLRSVNPTNGDITALCPNNLDLVESAAWDRATGVTPWYRDCAVPSGTIFADGFDGTP